MTFDPKNCQPIITVRGRLSRSKETPELHGQEVTAPDLERASGEGPVVISLPSTRCTPQNVSGLKEILAAHPGMNEVRLQLLTRNATKLMVLQARVTPSPALFADLKALLGPGCLTG